MTCLLLTMCRHLGVVVCVHQVTGICRKVFLFMLLSLCFWKHNVSLITSNPCFKELLSGLLVRSRFSVPETKQMDMTVGFTLICKSPGMTLQIKGDTAASLPLQSVGLCYVEQTVQFTSQVGWKHKAQGPGLHKKFLFRCNFQHLVIYTVVQVFLQTNNFLLAQLFFPFCTTFCFHLISSRHDL